MKFGILISSLIHEYMVTHVLWLVFLYNNNINNINDRNSNLEFYIDAL